MISRSSETKQPNKGRKSNFNTWESERKGAMHKVDKWVGYLEDKVVKQ